MHFKKFIANLSQFTPKGREVHNPTRLMLPYSLIFTLRTSFVLNSSRLKRVVCVIDTRNNLHCYWFFSETGVHDSQTLASIIAFTSEFLYEELEKTNPHKIFHLTSARALTIWKFALPDLIPSLTKDTARKLLPSLIYKSSGVVFVCFFHSLRKPLKDELISLKLYTVWWKKISINSHFHSHLHHHPFASFPFLATLDFPTT